MNHDPNDPSDFGVTAALYNEWRSPRFGDRNPSVMSSPVWDWLIRTKLSAFRASDLMEGSRSFRDGPGWSFDRFGQSCTKLPDGRMIYVAGEHEDYYDPDFHIYNDVVVEETDGSFTVYGYSKDDFPPTDFHTATLVGSEIILIGNLGYAESRDYSSTQVLALDTTSFAIRKLATSGDAPGWLCQHQAMRLNDGETVVVTEGKVDRGPGHFLVENIHDWALNLSTGVWRCSIRRDWSRWIFFRSDKSNNSLWQIRNALWSFNRGFVTDYDKELASLQKRLGGIPDIGLVEDLYRPDVQHAVLPKHEDEFGVYRIEVDGITVRYVEESRCIYMAIEGALPELTVRQLVGDVRQKIATLENMPYDVVQID